MISRLCWSLICSRLFPFMPCSCPLFPVSLTAPHARFSAPLCHVLFPCACHVSHLILSPFTMPTLLITISIHSSTCSKPYIRTPVTTLPCQIIKSSMVTDIKPFLFLNTALFAFPCFDLTLLLGFLVSPAPFLFWIHFFDPSTDSLSFFLLPRPHLSYGLCSLTICP